MNSRYRIAIVVAGLVLTLGGAASWGQVPPTNDTSDQFGNTGGGTGALVNVTPAPPKLSLDGIHNTAYGASALNSNTVGSENTAVGFKALSDNITGGFSAAVGFVALSSNTFGLENTAVGAFALSANTTGSNNIALGAGAGANLTSGNNNIYLGNDGVGSESDTMRLGQGQSRIFIAGIAGTQLGEGGLVSINSNGQLGTIHSSARYKRDIHAMGARSQGLYQLRPVTFRYKQDPQGQKQYGLIAEEVAKVYPELVVRGAKGEVESVQYHELIPMLLNEVQHQQRQIEELKAQNEHLQAALLQQTATMAARLERLEAGNVQEATLTTR